MNTAGDRRARIRESEQSSRRLLLNEQLRIFVETPSYLLLKKKKKTLHTAESGEYHLAKITIPIVSCTRAFNTQRRDRRSKCTGNNLE